MKLALLVSLAQLCFSTAIPRAQTDLVTRADGDRGSYAVDGLGTRKQAVLDAGGNAMDLAIAMLET